MKAMPASQPPLALSIPWASSERGRRREKHNYRRRDRQMAEKKKKTDKQMQRQKKRRHRYRRWGVIHPLRRCSGREISLLAVCFQLQSDGTAWLTDKVPSAPTHRGGPIAYRKICLLSRVRFSRSTLACKITSVNWLNTGRNQENEGNS